MRNSHLVRLSGLLPEWSAEIADYERLSRWARFIRLTGEEYVQLSALDALIMGLALEIEA